MNYIVVTLALGTFAATFAVAEETKPLQLKPKAAIMAAAPHNYAPFVNPLAADPEVELVPRRDPRQEQSRSSCESDRSLCYDPTSGRIVYKPAREYMPEIPGLRREALSVKRDRIMLRYSF